MSEYVDNMWSVDALTELLQAPPQRVTEWLRGREGSVDVGLINRLAQLDAPAGLLFTVALSVCFPLSASLSTEQQQAAHFLIETLEPLTSRLNQSTWIGRPSGEWLGRVALGWRECERQFSLPILLDTTIALFDASLARLPETNFSYPVYEDHLGIALGDRYDRSGLKDDLLRSVTCHEAAAGHATYDHPHYATSNGNAGVALMQCYEHDGNLEDLNRGIAYLESAISAIPPDDSSRLVYLNNLSNALRQRYDREGKVEDLERSITSIRQAVVRADQRPDDYPMYQNNLALALSNRFERMGDPRDLTEGIACHEDAVAHAPPNHSMYATARAGLGEALIMRYQWEGNPEDLDRSVRCFEDALAATPLHTRAYAKRQNDLGGAFGTRYKWSGDVNDLDRCVACFDAAVSCTSRSNPIYARHQSNLGTALLDRYKRHHDLDDLHRSLDCLTQAMSTSVQHNPEHAGYLHNLGAVVAEVYSLFQRKADLEAWIQLAAAAVSLTPSGPRRANCLHGLSVALLQRFKADGDVRGLVNCVPLLEEAVSMAGTQSLPEIGNTLAQVHLKLVSASKLEATAQEHLISAKTILDRSASALERMLAVVDEADEQRLLDWHGGLYDMLVSTSLRLADGAWQRGDAEAAQAHRRAAYLTAERAKDRRAAALLAAPALRPVADDAKDEDRQALLGTIDRLRGELALLDRQLATDADGDGIWEFDHVTAPLVPVRSGWLADAQAPDATETLALPRVGRPSPIGLTATSRAALERRAEEVWTELRHALDQLAHSDPDYANIRGFIPPKPPEEVAAALPPGGALLLLYPLEDALACFVIHHAPDETTPLIQTVAISLRTVDAKTGAQLAARGIVALKLLTERALTPTVSSAPASRMVEFTLGALAAGLYPALAPLLPPPDPVDPPSLVIVPTGPLHRLPLHALPWPDFDHRLLDGYTISYATSADVVLLAAAKTSVSEGAVALAPGLPPVPPIPATLAEAAHLAAQAGAVPLLRAQATRAALLDDRVATKVRWVLLATHGRAGGTDPSRAGLLLHDGHASDPDWLTAAEILTLLPLDGVEHLGLAACSTHADEVGVGDRLAGLLRALLYRGARSVQATLWPVRDDAAALVSAWTWEALLDGETNKAAALRAAVQRLRRCTGREAASELRRIAADLATMLPADDPAHGQLETLAQAVDKQGRPFLRSPDWAPFVLHGAPLTAKPA